jgi:hypothetical protein
MHLSMPESGHGARRSGTATLQLSRLQPIARGGSRLVYEHPHDPDALIKVARADRLRIRSWRRQWLSGLSAESCFRRRALREVDEFLSLYVHCGDVPSFVAPILGLVNTDVGIGLVVARMRARDGSIAPSVGDIVEREGLTDALRDQIRRLCDLLESTDLIVNDLRPANLVRAWDAVNGERLVLVDGLGDKTLVPIDSLSPFARRVNRRRRVRRLVKRLGM